MSHRCLVWLLHVPEFQCTVATSLQCPRRAVRLAILSEPPAVARYAVYLGIDPKEDVDLLWIAEEALTAGEPEGWSEMMDP